MSTRRCPHATWIAQPLHNRYLYHCRECAVVISHDITTDTWQASADDAAGELLEPPELARAFCALDLWMTDRENLYRHHIFTHPQKFEF